jgi:hypothetical protein
MNPLVKKEIRLLLPSFMVAVLLAMVQGITRPYDFYVASLLFFGLTIMALTTIGRESSLNTFSAMLAQPAERIRIWQTKLSVLAVAFLIVFLLWLGAFGIAFFNSSVDADTAENSYNLFIAICLIATATFTGGLWTTLLLRQIAGAFWLTLLVPAVLAGFTGGFVAANHSINTFTAVLCVVLGIYSVAGFLFARWLFFRAQDVGWSGGTIVLPEWKVFAGSENAISARSWKPIFALFKKELQLHQATLMGAAGLLVLHLGILVLRKYHHFAEDSAGEVLTTIFWLLWLVIPVVVGNLAVAEERRLGVMEGQLCLPVSRRIQFAIKGILTLLLGTFLGGAMPMLLESIGVGLGANSDMFKAQIGSGGPGFVIFQLGIVALAAWLSLVSFFASTLAKNFLQAIGLAIATFVAWAMLISGFAVSHRLFYGSFPTNSFLPLVISTPTIIVTLLWLAYLNFKNFRDGWPLWRRNILGIAGALVFIAVSSAALYNRVWEVFEPAEPPHDPAKLTLANPPTLKIARDYSLLVRLPDGRVWFDVLGGSPYDYGSVRWKYVWQMLAHPLPESIGPQQFLAGSNWVAATTTPLPLGWNESDKTFRAFMETVGIQPDGTLWISDKPAQNKWSPGTLHQFGSETNWHQLAQGATSIVLLKSDGTLWRWGLLTNELHQWPGLRTSTPYQIGTNADWQELFTLRRIFARQTDGGVWLLDTKWNKSIGEDELVRVTNYDQIVSKTASSAGDQATAFVRTDGTLWVLNRYWDEVKGGQMMGSGVLQVGKENDWRAVATSYHMTVALKADGSLWQWNFQNRPAAKLVNTPPTRLGIHNDWVAITGKSGSVIALAADGSLWLWPDRQYYDNGYLLKLPKQPQFLGNIFGNGN